MPSNHILIGLGGTGGSILRSFRKIVFQNCRAEDPEGVNIGYLYVDSNDTLMALDEPSWKILGTSVQLPQQSQLKIAGHRLDLVLDNVKDYPGIAPWIGNRDMFREILRSASAAKTFGGQKRRLGRFLFACHVKEYLERLDALVRQLQVGSTSELTFHFILGFAGGTGSGSIVDAVCQTRAKFNREDYRINIYGLLPDKHPKRDRAGENYHANGYAALQELNALDVGRYQPYDVSGTQLGRLNLLDPYNLCYLFTDENEDKNRVDIDTELPDIVASFLFQKIVNTKDLIWKGEDLIRRQETFEIGSQAIRKEMSPAGSRAERTRRFFTFGTKQIAYPEEEIREFLTYTYARQAALQLQFNNFSTSFGFVDTRAEKSIETSVTTKEVAQRWLIAEENLILSAGVLKDERENKKWKPIAKYWQDLLPNFKDLVLTKNAGDKARWLSELYKLFDLSYESNYRDLGVRRFYEVKRQEQDRHVREIRRTIENDLFSDWVNGTKSMTDITETLKALVAQLAQQRGECDEKLASIADLIKQSEAQVNANGQEYASRINDLFAQLLGKHKGLFEAHGETLRELYTLRTRSQGFEFARGLLDGLITDLTILTNEALQAASMITGATKVFTSAIKERLRDEGQGDITAQVVRFYNPDLVRDFAESLVRNEEEQRIQTASVRMAIAASLGAAPTFQAFNNRITEQTFRDLLEKTSALGVEKAHDAVMNADASRERVLRVSVLDRLEKEYGGNREALRAYISKIVSQAKSQLIFDKAQVGTTVPGKDNKSLGKAHERCTIIIPEGKDKKGFHDAVVAEFEKAQVIEHEIVTNPKRPNEITIINITSAFPARFVQDVAFLKERYDARVAESGDQARFELHTEGDGTEWPSLFLPRTTRAETLPVLLLGQALGFVENIEDPQTGRTAFYLRTKGVDGEDNKPRELGKDIDDAADLMSAEELDELDVAIQQRMVTTHRHRAKREEAYAAVRAAIEKVTTLRTNPLDAVRQAYIDAGRAVYARLELSSRRDNEVPALRSL